MPSDEIIKGDLSTWLRAQTVRMEAIDRRLERGDERMEQFESDLKANTEATQRIERSQDRMGTALMENINVTKGIEKSTGEMLEAFEAAKGGFKVLQWIGKVAAPLAAILGLPVALWSAYKAWKGL